MLRDNLVGLIAPMQSSGTQTSDDRSSCLENPRPTGAESSLTESTSSPFQTEPRQIVCRHLVDLVADDTPGLAKLVFFV